MNLTLDFGVVGFMLLLSLFSGIAFGLAPALQTSKPDLVPALKDTGTVGSYRGSRLRSLLVIVQVASSLILAIGSGLFVKNFGKIFKQSTMGLRPSAFSSRRSSCVFRDTVRPERGSSISDSQSVSKLCSGFNL